MSAQALDYVVAGDNSSGFPSFQLSLFKALCKRLFMKSLQGEAKPRVPFVVAKVKAAKLGVACAQS